MNKNSEALSESMNEFRSTSFNAHDHIYGAEPSGSSIENDRSELGALDSICACEITTAGENSCEKCDVVEPFTVRDSMDEAGPSNSNIETDRDDSVVMDDAVACEITVSTKSRKKRNADGIELDPGLVDIPRSYRTNVSRRPALSKRKKHFLFICFLICNVFSFFFFIFLYRAH